MSLPLFAAVTLLSVSTFAHVLIGVRDVQRIRAEDVARQREKLAVLNRLVRHNLRHEAQRLLYVQSELPDATDEPTRRDLAADVGTVAGALTDMNDHLTRSRGLIRGDPSEFETVDLATTVQDVVAEYREEYPEATFDVDVPSNCRAAGGEYLRHAISELVENASCTATSHA